METDSDHLKEAQSLLEKKLRLGHQLGAAPVVRHRQGPEDYHGCQSQQLHFPLLQRLRLSLQLANALLLSQLWDEKTRRPGLVTNAQPVADFFNKKRF
ncbi:MAG: hypothetical protein IPJ00_16425 [Saprospirales bacterium]|nr:hypothetical protein [Saprospirales bacterium]